VTFQLSLELRKQAKERVRERRAAGEGVKLAEVQFELARELGFHSWPKLKAYVERLALEQPFRTDLDYYEGRAHGIATVNGVSAVDARLDLAARHGFSSWRELRRHIEAMRSGVEPATPFMVAYQAIEENAPSTGLTAASPRGSPPTIRRRCSTRRSSGLRSPIVRKR
jgi:hypothetical protein